MTLAVVRSKFQNQIDAVRGRLKMKAAEGKINADDRARLMAGLIAIGQAFDAVAAGLAAQDARKSTKQEKGA